MVPDPKMLLMPNPILRQNCVFLDFFFFKMYSKILGIKIRQVMYTSLILNDAKMGYTQMPLVY